VVENSIQDIIVKHNQASKSADIRPSTLLPEAGEHVPIGCVVNRPTALPAVSLDNIHLALIKSYILDSGVTDHVCNDRSRFIDFTPAPSDKLLVAGTTAVRIEGYRTVSITMECEKTESTLDGKRTFMLYNVVYIPSFTTSMVYYNRFHDKGIF